MYDILPVDSLRLFVITSYKGALREEQEEQRQSAILQITAGALGQQAGRLWE